MNAIRRKAIKGIVAQLEQLEELRTSILEELETLLDEEQEALENMPESLQESERGQQMQEYIDDMDDIKYELEVLDVEDFMVRLTEIVEG